MTTSKKPKTTTANLFTKYAPSAVVEPDGIEALFKDLDVSPYSIKALAFMWGIGASSMGKITQQEWQDSDNFSTISSITSFINEKFAKLRDEVEAFEGFYNYLFDFCKHDRENQKVIDLETCISMLDIIFGSDADAEEVAFVREKNRIYTHMQQIIHYLSRNSDKIKCLNKDQWSNFILFSKHIAKDFSNWDENSAWPLLLDNYVVWTRQQQS